MCTQPTRPTQPAPSLLSLTWRTHPSAPPLSQPSFTFTYTWAPHLRHAHVIMSFLLLVPISNLGASAINGRANLPKQGVYARISCDFVVIMTLRHHHTRHGLHLPFSHPKSPNISPSCHLDLPTPHEASASPEPYIREHRDRVGLRIPTPPPL